MICGKTAASLSNFAPNKNYATLDTQDSFITASNLHVCACVCVPAAVTESCPFLSTLPLPPPPIIGK